MIEGWYDVVKKVMRIWDKGTLNENNKKQRNNETNFNDIDDFFVYLYDEEDNSN
jgi:hypothetical protein